MTVDEAAALFANQPRIVRRLRTLQDVGLGYIRLGQPATQLSGGEAQRVKLSTELSRRDTGRTLYILDEPTTGLHFADVEKLLTVLHRLVDAGNTVIVIEHNLDVVKTADWIVDLGPDGGDAGGEVVAAGTPEMIAGEPRSATGSYLRRIIGGAAGNGSRAPAGTAAVREGPVASARAPERGRRARAPPAGHPRAAAPCGRGRRPSRPPPRRRDSRLWSNCAIFDAMIELHGGEDRRQRLRRLDDCLTLLEQAHEMEITVVTEKMADALAGRVPTVHSGMLVAEAIEEVLREQEPYMVQVRPEVSRRIRRRRDPFDVRLLLQRR